MSDTLEKTSEQVFLDKAAELLGAKGFTRDPDLMEPWLTDWRGRYTGRALALASPGSTQEVAQLMKLCARCGVPIVPQGGNSGMVGGATPDGSGSGILLSLRRMDRVRRLDADAGQACRCRNEPGHGRRIRPRTRVGRAATQRTGS